MRTKRNKLICFILTILVLLLGIYFESIKTDSLFVYAPVEGTDVQTLSYGAVLREADFCTTEMLGVRNYGGIQQLTSCYLNQEKVARVSLNFLCSDVFSMLGEKFFTGSEVMRFHSQYQEELVVHYIEKSDGKKRI